MKAIQVSMDEELLARLDACEEVREEGRSAVLRRAVADYLSRQRRKRISRMYRQAYREADTKDELGGWPDEAVWPGE